MKVIDIQNISKTYNEKTIPVHAVTNVNLQFEEGEFAALVGPSGSGKTTLLNIIGGLDKPSSGKVLLAGTDVTDLPDSKMINFRLNNIGFVFQAYNLIPVLTARENVEFIMLLQQRPKAERDKRVIELLDEVGLGNKLDVRPNELSGGQQQRVAVARALASKPKFILADEPTANLDSHSAANLLDIMYKLNREENMTFIFSTHDQRVIDRAHRIVTLTDGVVSSDVVNEKQVI
jgi:putative ABC transport system ATP-binding protein